MKILAINNPGDGPEVNVKEARAVIVRNATDEDGFELILKHDDYDHNKIVATITGPGRHEFDPVTGWLKVQRVAGGSRITVIVECG